MNIAYVDVDGVTRKVEFYFIAGTDDIQCKDVRTGYRFITHYKSILNIDLMPF